MILQPHQVTSKAKYAPLYGEINKNVIPILLVTGNIVLLDEYEKRF